MYTLTLTRSERSAIDWVGNRYRHGDELYDILIDCTGDSLTEWDDEKDIEFSIPEYMAWEIASIIDDGLDCFAPELVAKLREFRNSIV